MVSSLRLIDWDKFEIAVPAFFTVLMMPLGYSIVSGIAIGFVFYPITMLLAGRKRNSPNDVWSILCLPCILHLGTLVKQTPLIVSKILIMRGVFIKNKKQ